MKLNNFSAEFYVVIWVDFEGRLQDFRCTNLKTAYKYARKIYDSKGHVCQISAHIGWVGGHHEEN